MHDLLKQSRCIVFDLDGTLVDSMQGFNELASEIINKYFAVDKQTASQMYRDTSGIPFRYQIQKLFGDHDMAATAVDEFEFSKLNDSRSTTFFEDVPKGLRDLGDLGYNLCVSSNNHHENVETVVEPVKENFSLILGYKDNFLKGKQHFDFIQKELNISTEQMLFVGDSLHDAQKSYELKIPFIARLGTFSAEDFDELKIPMLKIDNLNMLIDHFKEV
ncbi:hypothetical protein BVY03_01105 [bacterium K02(2017)]|nr:hypothetical protein BVY03_01105 [bacterium K02(2017)]